MSKRFGVLSLVLTLVVAFGVGAAAVSADSGTTAIDYRGGRINAEDVSAPVAVYYDYSETTAYNEDDNPYPLRTVTGISLWGIDADSVGHLEMYVPISNLVNAAVANGGWAELEANGYVVGYSTSGWLWVKAPGGYSYGWSAFVS